ncbi:MAG: PAS domain S-box protein [Pyrinomonadaceae bacterium]
MRSVPSEPVLPGSPRVARTLGIALAAAALVGGALSLAGWLIPIYRLTDWDGDGIVTKFNTALAITIASAALLTFLISHRAKVLVRVLALVSALIGFATLIEQIFLVDLRIDNLLVHDTGGMLATASPGRMGPPAATMLTLIGTSIVLVTLGPRSRRVASMLGLVVLAIVSLSITGYIYGADQLYSIPRLTGIALHTAGMLAVMGVALVAAVPEWGATRALSRADSGGLMFRRLLLPMLLLAIVLGWFRIIGQTAGYYDTAFGTAARTVAEIILLIGLLWWAASSTSRADRQVRLLSRMPEENPSPVLRLTPSGDVMYSNSAAAKLVEHLDARPDGKVANTIRGSVEKAVSTGDREDLEIEFDGHTYIACIAPVPELGHVNLYANDITDRKSAEATAAAQASEQAVLYRLTDRVHRADTPEEVYNAALDAIMDGILCDRGSVLVFNDAGVMSFVASRGLSEEYCHAVTGHSPWHPGDTNAAPITIPDIRNAEITEELRNTIIGEGIGALGFVPLNSSDGVVIGKFMVYNNEPHEFTESELELAVTVGRQISFGIERKLNEQALRENEERLRLATQTGKVGIWDWDIAADHVSWTHSLYQMHGVAPGDFDGSGAAFAKLVHPDDNDRVQSAIYAALNGERPYDQEFRILRPDGTTVWIYTNATVVGEGKTRRMIGAVVDITERKEAELASQQLAAIVRSSADAVISLDLAGNITSWNHGAENIFGYNPNDAIGRSVLMLLPEERWSEETEILDRIKRGEVIEHYETVRITRDGHALDISLTISPIRDADGKIVGASKIARDMTHRKRAQEAIRTRETLERIVEAQEAERNRIARDLHDHLGQQLTGLRLKLASIKSLAAENRAVVNEIENAAHQANQIDTDLSLLAWELRPVSLDSHGLSESLASFVREWGQSHGITAEFHCIRQKGRLAPAVETNLYRIAQEALNNILKHAAAREVSVTLNQTSKEAVLVIEDDGRGFDPEETSPSTDGGLGLVGMRERATLLGGNLEIESHAGGGTAIYARIPLAQNTATKHAAK